jgi:hypothetical protein
MLILIFKCCSVLCCIYLFGLSQGATAFKLLHDIGGSNYALHVLLELQVTYNYVFTPTAAIRYWWWVTGFH